MFGNVTLLALSFSSDCTNSLQFRLREGLLFSRASGKPKMVRMLNQPTARQAARSAAQRSPPSPANDCHLESSARPGTVPRILRELGESYQARLSLGIGMTRATVYLSLITLLLHAAFTKPPLGGAPRVTISHALTVT